MSAFRFPAGRALPLRGALAAGALALATIACARQGSGISIPAERLAFTPGDLRAHVQELASDAYEGRGSGYAGENKAAAYIERQFRSIGLRPAGDASPSGRSYRQTCS